MWRWGVNPGHAEWVDACGAWIRAVVELSHDFGGDRGEWEGQEEGPQKQSVDDAERLSEHGDEDVEVATLLEGIGCRGGLKCEGFFLKARSTGVEAAWEKVGGKALVIRAQCEFTTDCRF